MGIGTSLGAYFEDTFKHQSGVEEVIEPKDPGDKNVVSPEKRETDKQLEDIQMQELGGIDVSFKTPVGGSTEPAGALKSEEATEVAPKNKSFLDRLSIVNAFKGMMNPNNIKEDIEIFKNLWSALKLPGDVAKGEIDPSSPEGIQKAFDLALAVGTGRMPKAKVEAKVLEGEVIPPYETLPSVQDTARQRIDGIRSERNAREARADAMFAQEADPIWAERDRRLASQIERFEQIPFEGPSAFDPWEPVPNKFGGKMAERITEAKAKGSLNFFETPQERAYGKHYFASENGVGEINVHYRPASKTLHVSDIGIIEDVAGNKVNNLSYESFRQGPQSIGFKDTKKVLQYLKETYPEAEWVSGYRVSGAREKKGSGPAEAKMWIGKGPKPKASKPKQLTAEDYQRMSDELNQQIRDGTAN
jgi:hypothetical protein